MNVNTRTGNVTFTKTEQKVIGQARDLCEVMARMLPTADGRTKAITAADTLEAVVFVMNPPPQDPGE